MSTLLLANGCGKQPAEPIHIGFLIGLEYFDDTLTGFKDEMEQRGFLEGTDVIYSVRRSYCEEIAEEHAIAEFVDDGVDLIVATPTQASLAAKNGTRGTNIPVVFANAVIEGVHLVNSIQEPGDNITGVRFLGPDLVVKRFEHICEILPDVKRIVVPYLTGYPTLPQQLADLRCAADAVGVEVVELSATNGHELETLLNDPNLAGGQPIDAILMIAEPLAVDPTAFQAMGKYAREQNVLLGGLAYYVGESRSVFGLSIDVVMVGRQAARMVEKILGGTPAGSIPVESPDTFLEVHCGAAAEVGVTIPEGLLSRADTIVR